MAAVSTLGLANLNPWEQLRAPKLLWRLTQLTVSLWVFGFSMGMVIVANLGAFPWDVLHVGLSHHVPLTVGQIIMVVALVVMVLWIPLKQMPGLGTVANSIVIGFSLDWTLGWLESPSSLPARIALMLGGIVLNALCTAAYIGSQLGPGPRDGLMTGYSRKYGLSLRLVRTVIEVIVVAIGWALGGVFWVGTILFALTIGPLTQFFLPYVVVRLPVREPDEVSAASPQ